jgi:hypothetical protein
MVVLLDFCAVELGNVEIIGTGFWIFADYTTEQFPHHGDCVVAGLRSPKQANNENLDVFLRMDQGDEYDSSP